MSDGAEWFAPKRHGYGAAWPISWQGWAVTLAYAGAITGAVVAFRERPTVLIATIFPATALFIVIAARTTRGGWRWRWGEED